MESRNLVGFGGGKSGGGAARSPVEARDSLRSRAFAQILDLVSEGQIGGLVNGLQSVYLDDTPVQNPDGTHNFPGITFQIVDGAQNQPVIPGFPSAESEVAVSTDVTQAVPVVRQITNANLDAVRIRLRLPNGLSQRDLTTGDLNGSAVDIGIDIQPNGEGYLSYLLTAAWNTGGISVSGDTATATVPLSGIAAAVSWDKPARTFSIAFGQQPPRYAITFNIEYRLVGAPAWSFYRQESLTDTDFQQTLSPLIGTPTRSGPIIPGFVVGGTQTQAITPYYQQQTIQAGRTYEIMGLAEGVYEMRVAKVVGDGSLFLSYGRVYVGLPYHTLAGKASSAYELSYLIPLRGQAPWNIRVRRLTPDSTITTLVNQTVFESYTEIIDDKLSYPNSAAAALRVDASQFRTIPRRGYHLKGILVRVPSNYDPIRRSHAGIWDGSFKIAWTDNPAWCFYDLCTNTRYGLGDYIDQSQIDKAALYTIGQYCDTEINDGFGGGEPRFTCNLYLQTRQEAFEWLTAMASIFRGMLYWAEGTIKAVLDGPSDAVKLFTASNVIDGMFTYQGSSRKARHTVCLVTWNDPQDFYRQKVEYVEDQTGIQRYGVVQTEVPAIGCTSRGQAHRLGKWLLYSETSETETVTFQVGMDGGYVRPGDIIKVNDAHRAGVRYGGRLSAATVSSINIDAPIDLLAGESYSVYAVLPTGAVELRTVTNVPGVTSVLNVSPNWSQLPNSGSQWLIRYENLEPQTFRVISIAEAEKNIYEITALSHNASKFNTIENDVALVIPQTSQISIVPDAPRNVIVGEYFYLEQSSVRTRLTVSFEAAPRVARYLVEYRRDNGNWIALPQVTSNFAEANDIAPGQYVARVSSINSLGKPSSPTLSAQTRIFGKTAPPPDVTSFLVQRQPDGTREFSWTLQPTPLDVTYGGGFRIKYKLDNPANTWENMIELHSGFLSASPYESNQLAAGTYDFAIKAIDSSGNESVNANFITTTLGDPRIAGAIEAFDEVSQQWDGTKTSCHLETETGFLVADGTAVWSTLPSTWAGWTRWNHLPASPIVYERVIDVGVVTSFTPLVSVNGDGVFTITESHKDTAGGAYSSYATVGPMLTTRFVKLRISLAGSYPIIRSALMILAANAISEEMENLATASLTGANRIGVGDIRLPITQSYAVIRTVLITLQNTGPGFSFEIIDKNSTLGPRVKFYNNANVLTDCTVDVYVRGL